MLGGNDNKVGRGFIDIHSHMLPGVDDGCQDSGDVLRCIEQLKGAGFVGSFCTPHMGRIFPENTPQHVRQWTGRLKASLADAGVSYDLWPGGELGLFDAVIPWLEKYGPPTLGESRCVLLDMWFDDWPTWVMPAFRWLVDNKYQPIWAHPERVNAPEELPQRLAEAASMGVWLQGNVRSFTGEEGYLPDLLARQWLAEGRYRFLAIDMHGPGDLASRLEAIELIAKDFGGDVVQAMLGDNVRRDVLGDARQP
jgi:protein-tyrosine phosphatase